MTIVINSGRLAERSAGTVAVSERARQRPSAWRLDAQRSTKDGYLGMLVGHFGVVNEWVRIDGEGPRPFMERIAPGAFMRTIAEDGPRGSKRIRCLFQHGTDPQLGNKPLGPVRHLEEDQKGASYEVPLHDTSNNRQILPGLRAGEYGASFRFRVGREAVDQNPPRSSHNPDGIEERTVLEVRVREFGPVTFPAYAGATAEVRSRSAGRLDDRAPDAVAYLRALDARQAEVEMGNVQDPVWRSRSTRRALPARRPSRSWQLTDRLGPVEPSLHITPSAMDQLLPVGRSTDNEISLLAFGPYPPAIHRPTTVTAFAGREVESGPYQHRRDSYADAVTVRQMQSRGLYLVGSVHTHRASRAPSAEDVVEWKRMRLRHKLAVFWGALLVLPSRYEYLVAPWIVTSTGTRAAKLA